MPHSAQDQMNLQGHADDVLLCSTEEVGQDRRRRLNRWNVSQHLKKLDRYSILDCDVNYNQT